MLRTRGTTNMNAFENVILGLLQGVEMDAPLFIKSPHGNLILNASENILASVLGRFAPPAVPPAPAAAPAPPVSSN
jgi:hypothetical protein